MANNLNLSNAAANAGLDAITALLNSGFLDIYDGSQPANANIAIGAQVRLASLTFGATAFGASAAGVAAANAIGTDVSNDATGTATWARLWKSDHTSVVMDLSVGTSGCDINLDSVAIQVGAQTSITALTLTLPE